MPEIVVETGVLGGRSAVAVKVEGHEKLVILRPEDVANVTIWHFTRPDGKPGTAVLQSTAVTMALGIDSLPNWPV